ncbi:hypothetical protein [Mucilaginibacter auburnensis]|uniref:Uncharacterized protein n=1 Tax=Mucilaginibacter auburnensis TaxID=1457233 RepID=A0A2H9VVQ9_9SPHI|nr:hypothetical protein [Mucilaginibacter auburnensis]PJJ84905.1 hypothetical protein CLV57_1927 [Mucilaginibacter auburnensis]
MKKIVITAIVAFTVGTLSILTTSDCKECAPALNKSANVAINDQSFLATAD